MEPEKRIEGTVRGIVRPFFLDCWFSKGSGAPSGGRPRATGTHGAAGRLGQRSDAKKAAGEPTTLLLAIFKYILYFAL